MRVLADVFVAIVALIHLYIVVLEMFLWTTPRGQKIFRITPEFAQASAALAKNQGLYNGFLAAGLIFGLLRGPAGYEIKLFFLGCVIVAGVFGAMTVNRRILYVQAVPALIGLIAMLLS